jgi:hypothetical protein
VRIRPRGFLRVQPSSRLEKTREIDARGGVSLFASPRTEPTPHQGECVESVLCSNSKSVFRMRTWSDWPDKVIDPSPSKRPAAQAISSRRVGTCSHFRQRHITEVWLE